MSGWTLPLVLGLGLEVLVFGLSLIRREGLPLQVGLETAVLAILAAGFVLFTGIALHPILFFVALYVVVMRSRLLVDVGNFFSARRQFLVAQDLYLLAMRLGPETFARHSAMINLAVSHIRQQQWENAIDILTALLETADGTLSPKLEAACRFNLGVAYEKQGRRSKALEQYQVVARLLPHSPYGVGASHAIKRSEKS